MEFPFYFVFFLEWICELPWNLVETTCLQNGKMQDSLTETHDAEDNLPVFFHPFWATCGQEEEEKERRWRRRWRKWKKEEEEDAEE